MAEKLTGKVAVVTGAGSISGIGKEVALAMAAEGAMVVVNDIVKDPDGSRGADRVVNEIKSASGTAMANYDSVASMEGGRKIIRNAIINFGRIDILVNAAGNFKTAPTVEFTEEDWDAILNVHLKGLFACTQEAIKEMIKQESGGRIINFTSVAAYTVSTGPGPSAAYCTAKAGILGFTRLLALEMQEYGITANSISPIATTALNPYDPDQPGPEYVAPMVVYLATDDAKVINGQVIYISGGDVRVYAPPMGTLLGHHYLHKEGKWTAEELTGLMPGMIQN